MIDMLLLIRFMAFAACIVVGTHAAGTSTPTPQMLLRGTNNHNDHAMISVEFYGEAQCPFCRKFVTDVWHEIWSDKELRSHINYTFVPWGNAYFATTMCGQGPYDPKERACFYDKCITHQNGDDDACFGGDAVYQHSTKEGQMDIYESCIILKVGLAAAVDFTYCAEKPGPMDDDKTSAHDILLKCSSNGAVDPKVIETCLKEEGREIEIANAKKTPVHKGVPYVVVDGLSMDNPFDTKQRICELLTKEGVHPQKCASSIAVVTTS